VRRIIGLFAIISVLVTLAGSVLYAQSMPPVDPKLVVGDIITAGSSTASPLIARLAERFRSEGYLGNLLLDTIGSAAAFQRFCNGEIDVVNSDRLISPDETLDCQNKGRTPLAFQVGSDAMVVAVSTQNTFVVDLTTAELQLIFSTALNWSDVRPEWPPVPINRYIPAAGTEDLQYMADQLFDGNSVTLTTAIGAQTSTDYNALLQGVRGDPNAIGLFPASFVIPTRLDALVPLSLNQVVPTQETITSGSYTLTRPIVLYSDRNALTAQVHIGAWLNYVITHADSEVASLNLFSAGEQNLAQARSAWLQASSLASPIVTVTAPSEPLAGVFCATTGAMIRINSTDAPTPVKGCVCVEAYGLFRLQIEPDLYMGQDQAQISTFTQSTTQCLDGVTTYQWTPAGGFSTEGKYTPNINSPDAILQPTITAPTLAADADVISLTIDARTDLELLANQITGIGRPQGWSGILDIANPDFILLTRLDLELLADAALGGTRPVGWFGAIPSSEFALARDLRHDLELLATALLNAERPIGWIGVKNPMHTCNRATQTLVNMLQRGGVFTLSANPLDPNFCYMAEVEATIFTELNLLSNPIEEPIFAVGASAVAAAANTIDTDFAVAFLDKGAALSVGVVPKGTGITAIGRSTSTFSRMTLVQGEGFLVFVDYRDTTLNEDVFEDLPDSGTIETQPFCQADWCGE
jgi:phosphate transport system substrate-binding protein